MADRRRLPLPYFSANGDAATEWPKWRDQFEYYMKSPDNARKSGPAKVAALLAAMGRQAAEIFNEFDWGDRPYDRDDLEAVLSKFTERFVPFRSETYGRFLFRQRRQKRKESFDSFYSDLLELVRTCNYHDSEKPRAIRDQIVLGVLSDRLRQKLLAEPTLTLEKAVDIGRAQSESDNAGGGDGSSGGAPGKAEAAWRASESSRGMTRRFPSYGGSRPPCAPVGDRSRVGGDATNHTRRRHAELGDICDDNGGGGGVSTNRASEYCERQCFPAKKQCVSAAGGENASPPAAAAGKENVVIRHLGPDGSAASLVLATLQQIDRTRRSCQALVLAPTRELALKAQAATLVTGEHLGITCHACVGGTSVRQDAARLSRGGFDVVVGTPGRVMDLLKRRALDTLHMRAVVVDEAAELLSTRDFSKSLSDIIEQLPADVRVMLVSAALSPGVKHFASTFTRNPIEVLVKKEPETAPDDIRQFYVFAKRDKYSALIDLYRTTPMTQVVIFCNAKNRVDWLAEKMKTDGFAVSRVHGQMHMNQAERNSILYQFRHGECRTLIATDGLSFGIDSQHVSVVINYDLPVRQETYLNRISCCGRLGRKGVIVNFISADDREGFQDLKEFCNAKIEELPSNIADYL